ncbi:MAG TPA: thiamine pyrophosphate-dependent enzyme, partial [Balneolaceae bacterium]|nr:thiamine pyrophosphate-dependent enzyme [Balneolaceae bacterium]
YEKKDPIERLKKYLLDNDIADEAKIKEIEDKVEDTVMEAIDFAEESDFPAKEDLYKDVFVEDDYPFHT